MKIELTTKEIYGNPQGKLVWLVTTIDTDDNEDTMNDIWLADNEGELEDLVRKTYLGDEDDEDEQYEFMAQQFDDDWGFKILYTQLGTTCNPSTLC
jgi:hypothetical protein